MPCPKQLSLRAGMGFNFKIIKRNLQKGRLIWFLCRSTLNNIANIQTRPPYHNPSQWLCGPYLAHIFQLYTSPHQSVYSCLGTSRRHKQNTKGISVWICSYTEALNDSFLGGGYLHLIIPSLPKQSVCTNVHFRETHAKLAVLTDVGVQTDNIHIMDFFPCLSL